MASEPPHFLHELYDYPGSFALLSSSEQVSTAIVFVHGFGGDPHGTWSDFHRLVDVFYADKLARCDLFFYSYPSGSVQVQLSVPQLASLLARVYPNPSESLFAIRASDIGLADDQELYPFEANRSYQNLILVAHSEGGLLVRRTMLHCLEVMERPRAQTAASSVHQEYLQDSGFIEADELGPDRAKELIGAKLCLFAPAICGYRPSGLKGAVLSLPGIGGAITGILNTFPAFQDMAPAELQDFKADAEAAVAKWPDLKGLRATVIWGDGEKLLKACWFKGDTPIVVPGKNHITVCKPTREYILPLKIVEE